jgi:hypothetical protein
MKKLVLIIVLFSITNATVYVMPDADTATFRSYQASASDGDVIVIPSVNYTVRTQYSNTPAYRITKSITLLGSGITGTIITDSCTGLYFENTILVDAPGKTVRISGIAFRKSSNSGHDVGQYGSVGIYRVGEIIIDHCRFYNATTGNYMATYNSQRIWGVVSRCTFDQYGHGNLKAYQINGEDTTYSISSPSDCALSGGPAWRQKIGLGTDSAFFFESNTVNWLFGSTVIYPVGDFDQGARGVIRHCVLNRAWAHNHGMDSWRNSWGCVSMETYQNTFTCDTNTGSTYLLNFRSGYGVVFGNVGTGTYNQPLTVQHSCADCENSNCGYSACLVPACALSYPMLCQVGQGPSGIGENQMSFGVYEWNNTLNGSDIDIDVYQAGNYGLDTFYLHSNRDFYNDQTMPGYTPYQYPHRSVGTVWYKDTAFSVTNSGFSVIDTMRHDSGKVVLQIRIKNGSWNRVDSSVQYHGQKDTLNSGVVASDTLVNTRLLFYGLGIYSGIIDTVGYDTAGANTPGYWDVRTMASNILTVRITR